MNTLQNTIPPEANEITISREDKEYFDKIDSEQKSRAEILRGRIRHYRKLIEIVHQNIAENTIELRNKLRNIAIVNNTALISCEELKAITHISYLRTCIVKYQNEISYLTGEGL